MRKLVPLSLAALAATVAFAIPAAANPRGADGRITFSRDNPALGDEWVYTANPDGSQERLLSATPGEQPRWSPDGTLVSFNPHVPDDGSVSVTIVNPDTGESRNVSNPDPSRFGGFYCGPWSPDGTRFACDVFGNDGALDGLYTMGASGGGVQQVTPNPNGEDAPTDYSPTGNRLVFLRNTDTSSGYFTVKTDGTNLRPLTPPDLDVNYPARWSPQGNDIVFSAHVPDFSYRSSLMVVHSDGTGLRRIPVPGCGGAISDPASVGCNGPSWSPDGQKIIFTRFDPAAGDQHVYTVDLDGTGLAPITTGAGTRENLPSWGSHPIEP